MKKHIVCFGDSNTHGYCAEPFDCADGALALRIPLWIPACRDLWQKPCV